MIANLRTIRKLRGMTQEELAKVSGIHRVTIAKYEAMTVDPTVEAAEKIANALGCTVNDLIRRDGECGQTANCQ